MAKLNREWAVQPHGPLTELEPGLLTVVGDIGMPLGTFPRRMTIVALSRGRVAIFSPAPLREPAMRGIEELGRVAFLIVPNGFHRLDAGPWKARYPKAKVICPPGAMKRVAEAVCVDATSDVLRDADTDFVIVDGTREMESAVLVRREAGLTLVVNDIISNIRHPKGIGANILARLLTFGVKRPQMAREVRWLLVRDKPALALQLRVWAALPDLVRLVPSHGEIIDRPRETLERIADSLA